MGLFLSFAVQSSHLPKRKGGFSVLWKWRDHIHQRKGRKLNYELIYTWLSRWLYYFFYVSIKITYWWQRNKIMQFVVYYENNMRVFIRAISISARNSLWPHSFLCFAHFLFSPASERRTAGYLRGCCAQLVLFTPHDYCYIGGLWIQY